MSYRWWHQALCCIEVVCWGWLALACKDLTLNIRGLCNWLLNLWRPDVSHGGIDKWYKSGIFSFFSHAAGLLAHHSLLVHSVQLQGVTLREWIEILVHETPPLGQTPGEALDLLLNAFNNLI